MGYGYVGRRRRPKPVPGEQCPARRSSKAYDDAVTITEHLAYGNIGTRTCGRCGREGVRVSQSTDGRGAPLTAWFYDPHVVPG